MPEKEQEPDAKLLISFYESKEYGFELAYSAVGLDVYLEDEDGNKKMDKEKLIPLFESILDDLKS